MDKETMSVWGVGPWFVVPGVILSVAGVVIDRFVLGGYSASGIAKFVFILLGAVSIILGIYLWSLSAFRIRKLVNQNELSQDGVYGIVRHPIYSGVFFAISGMLLLFQSYFLLIIPIILFVYLSLIIKKEEQTLIDHYGNDYLLYKSRVHAILPTFNKR